MSFTRNEIEELADLLKDAYRFVKGGPSPELEKRLLIYNTKIDNKLEENYNRCPTCDYEYSHMLATLTISDNDHYETTNIVVNGKFDIEARTRYDFRSQGNIHILFSCEDGHFFIKSYDGHKGIVFVDNNPLMNQLATYLNKDYSNNKEILFDFDYKLLGQIEKFFKLKDQETK